jgi:hypothetical protein
VPKHRSLPGIVAAICASAFLAPRAIQAARSDRISETPIDRMIDLNKRALADIQSQHFQAAKYRLEEALVISETAGLEQDEITARTYVHLAAVEIGGPRDREEAVRYLDLALKIAPNVQLTPGLELHGLRSAYLQARQQAGLPPNPDPTAPNLDPFLAELGSSALETTEALPSTEEARLDPAAANPSPSVASDKAALQEAGPRPSVREAYAAALIKEPDLPARVPAPLYCTLPLDVMAGQDLVVRCLTQKQTRRSSATFHHRPEDEAAPFAELPMDRSPKGWLVAVVPGQLVTGKALAYFVTAQAPGGAPPIYLGYPESPRSLLIRAEATAEASPEAEPAPEQARPPDVPSEHRRRAVGSVWFSVAGGSGVAYHGREPVDSSTKIRGTPTTVPVEEGFSPASLLQLEPELGYQVSGRLSVSLMARYQYAPKDTQGWSPGQDEQPVLTSALAVFLQARLIFLTLGNVQTYAAGGAGLGRSFLAVVEKDCGAQTCLLNHSDTLHGGGVGLLGGFGVLYHLSRRVGLFADVREIVTLPKFMALTELSLGATVAMQLDSPTTERVGSASGDGRL